MAAGGMGVDMTHEPRAVPFSVSILTLIALIVIPLASALLWLGWRAVDSLERVGVEQRVDALDKAVTTFFNDGLRTIISVGLAVATHPSFAPDAGRSADDERLRQLVGVLERQPFVAATFVGYSDGRFLHALRQSMLSGTQLLELGTPGPDAVLVRIIDGEAAARRETWWFVRADGTTTESRSRANAFDPRARPWYADAVRTHAPTLTEPYRFALSNEPGLSIGVPMKQGGVIGFDVTLVTLSHLIAEYKITPNAIVTISAPGSDIVIESAPCQASPAVACFSEDASARRMLREAAPGLDPSRSNIARDVEGRDYRLFVRSLAVPGRSFVLAAAVPAEELFADSRILVARAGIAAAIAIGLAILAVLAVSWTLSRSLNRIAARTERMRNLDFSEGAHTRSRISEIRQLSSAVERMRQGLEVFGRYVSKNLVMQIMRSPQSAGIGGVRRELTVMFTDIEGFSLISEHIEPELLTSRLSRYFEAVGAAIFANRGMIDKYIGDSVMAFWNAPEPDPDHVANACRAALQAADASRTLAERWRQRDRPPFRTRIGLHTGPAVVGNVGARERINYTMVGASPTRRHAWKGSTRSISPRSCPVARWRCGPPPSLFGAMSIASLPQVRPR
jgi:adenylate cyclase